MIRITQNGQPQIFALTCTELSVLVNPFYLFVFTHDMTKTVKSVVLVDSSLYKERYNLFQITGSFFDYPEWYSYEVYEQSNFLNTNPLLSTGLVEKGRAFITSLIPEKFTEYNTTINYKEYDKQQGQ